MTDVLLDARDISLGYPARAAGSRCWSSSTWRWRRAKW
jgi:hypothetical protein